MVHGMVHGYTTWLGEGFALGFGSGLNIGGEEVIGVVSCEMEK